jgi:hypothetical protein
MCTNGPSGSGVAVGVGSGVSVGTFVDAAVAGVVAGMADTGAIVGGSTVDVGRTVAVGGDWVADVTTLASVGCGATPPGVFVQDTETMDTTNRTATASPTSHRRTRTTLRIPEITTDNARV